MVLLPSDRFQVAPRYATLWFIARGCCLALIAWSCAVAGSQLRGAEPARIQFREVAVGAGIDFVHHSPFSEKRHTHLVMGSGIGWIDYDGDGRPDLFVANGHVHDRLRELARDEPFAQLAQCFKNEAGRRFRDVSATAGPYFNEAHLGRGCAVADFDSDGRLDLAVLQLNGPVTLLHNETQSANNTLQVELIGAASNRDAIGAMLTVQLKQRRLLRCRTGSSSYLSCDEARMSFGVGTADNVERLDVRWPSGRRESWSNVKVNTLQRFVEGTGSPQPDRE
ncbi:MAG: hypothetical protein CMJ48_01155 [Planctomycetaceae bacterium]|nr:hypothetical protein [Planctomycetaceae bacterium]